MVTLGLSPFQTCFTDDGSQASGSEGATYFQIKVLPADFYHTARKPEFKYSSLFAAYEVVCEEVKSSSNNWKKAYAQVLKMVAAVNDSPG
eukprot:snap_masked-scaffold_4-processed-gene-8.38-mRNA-1 protein AED:1.00 eAED:1.00 QI:0/-1/0/0/-1/1/1/0/89